MMNRVSDREIKAALERGSIRITPGPRSDQPRLPRQPHPKRSSAASPRHAQADRCETVGRPVAVAGRATHDRGGVVERAAARHAAKLVCYISFILFIPRGPARAPRRVRREALLAPPPHVAVPVE